MENRKYLQIKVVTRSSRNRVETKGEQVKVYTQSPPIQGRANKTVIKLLSEFFNIPASRISIVSGRNSSIKKVSFT